MVLVRGETGHAEQTTRTRARRGREPDRIEAEGHLPAGHAPALPHAGGGVRARHPHLPGVRRDEAQPAVVPPPFRVPPSQAGRPFCPRRLAAAGSASSRHTAAAMAVGSSGGTRMPVSPSRTASGTPPELPATTGRPHAEASTSEIPNPSTPSRSARREAPTYRDARL